MTCRGKNFFKYFSQCVRLIHSFVKVLMKEGERSLSFRTAAASGKIERDGAEWPEVELSCQPMVVLPVWGQGTDGELGITWTGSCE